MNQNIASWRLFSLALLYLFSAIFIATLLAYPIYHLLDLNVKFPRLINRLTLGLLIIGIYPLCRKINFSLRDLGFSDAFSTIAIQFSKGFLLGTVILGIVIYALLELDIRVIRQSELDQTTRLVRIFTGAIASGIIVALLEETLFRGLLFKACSKYGNVRSALFITAFFYAGLHFISGRGDIPVNELQWTTGFQLVPGALLQIFNPANFDSFLALFTVSLFLCAVLIDNPRGIGYCIGLHAAWVFILKLTRRTTDIAPESAWNFLVGSYDGVIGYLVAAWLFGITILYSLWIRKKLNAMRT